MKKRLFTLSLTFCFLSISAQNTWFKFVPGWTGNNSFIIDNTIYSFCPSSKIDSALVLGLNLNKSNFWGGQNYASDSFFFYSSKLKELTNLEYRTKNNSIFEGVKNEFLFAANYGDSVASNVKWQSDIFKYPEFSQLNIPLNYDSFDTKVNGFFEINKVQYALVDWQRKIDKLSTISSSRILKINKDKTVKLIYTKVNNSFYASVIEVQDIFKDNQNAKNLLIQLIDRWDWHGVPAQFEAVVQKIDTTGKLIWESRPVGDQDTINTTDFQMVQLPNGNILCSWLDYYYRPWKNKDYPYQFESVNKNTTLWFAEIDCNTGQRLWVKNIKQYLSWKMTPSDIEGRTDVTNILLTDAMLVDNSSVVWCGYRERTVKLTNSWKQLPVLLKTDLKGNPIWYREYNFYPSDTGDKGFKPYSFIQTPDKGFLLSGEYHNRFGQLSNGEWWQKAALLKLDSNGCFEPGCNATDNIIRIQAPNNICHVLPNPASNFINIEYPNDSRNWEIAVVDINGKEVFQSRETITSIPSNNLPNGTYLIKITNKNSYHYETHKIIIQH
jgi:hypothetical protein